jgi:hypothetical protein
MSLISIGPRWRRFNFVQVPVTGTTVLVVPLPSTNWMNCFPHCHETNSSNCLNGRQVKRQQRHFSIWTSWVPKRAQAAQTSTDETKPCPAPETTNETSKKSSRLAEPTLIRSALAVLKGQILRRQQEKKGEPVYNNQASRRARRLRFSVNLQDRTNVANAQTKTKSEHAVLSHCDVPVR